MVGTALRQQCEAGGHEVVWFIRGRRDKPGVVWDPSSGWVAPGALDGLDAIVNLGGVSIGEGRWTDSRKSALRTSRIDSTRLLVAQMKAMTSPPALISASAIGFYGDRGDQALDERSHGGKGFLAELTADWEAEAMRAGSFGARTVILRFGVILSANGGALPRMVRPFKFGVGGRLGSGNQWFSWVALDDVVGIIQRALVSDMSGIYNATAPEPVTNREFTRVLAATLHRPAIFPVPSVALRVLFGQTADEMLLASQRVMPRRIEEAGFEFKHANLADALRTALKG